jgi:hypothetical protein
MRVWAKAESGNGRTRCEELQLRNPHDTDAVQEQVRNHFEVYGPEFTAGCAFRLEGLPGSIPMVFSR